MKKFTIFAVAVAMFLSITTVVAAKKPWDGIVHAPLKTAQPKDWSAPDEFFTGEEGGSLKYTHEGDTFEGVLELDGFKQAGPYVLTVDTADGGTLAGYNCNTWKFWTSQYGETFVGGTNGCWDGNPYADVKLFTLESYVVDVDGDEQTYYKGTIPFDVPLLGGTYDLKFFVKLDWSVTSPDSNIMMMNDMTGDPRYGKVVKPRGDEFGYDEDLIITSNPPSWLPNWIWLRVEEGEFNAYDTFENLVLADDAWCVPFGWCVAPDQDPGYQGTTGVVFYKKISDTFEGTVVLSNTPQPLQIKLEGLGSLGADADSNEKIGYIGRWWDNNTDANISDAQYEVVKDTHDVLGYVVFDGFDTSLTTKVFSLDSSYHTLWKPQPGRPTPGNVVMAEGEYSAYFALTENTKWWRGVFLSENPVEFTIE